MCPYLAYFIEKKLKNDTIILKVNILILLTRVKY